MNPTRTQNRALIYGFHTVLACLKHQSHRVTELWFDKERTDQRLRKVIQQAETLGIPTTAVTRAQLYQASSHSVHQGIVAWVQETEQARLDLDDFLSTAQRESLLLLVLDGITDPHNLGACLRVADAMGVQAVIIPKDNSATLNATVRKVACGAAERLPLITVTNLARALDSLQAENIMTVGMVAAHNTVDKVTNSTQTLQQIALKGLLSGALAIILGAEDKGLRRLTREHCDILAHIPMHGSVASLNVSTACAIALYEVVRQRTITGGS